MFTAYTGMLAPWYTTNQQQCTVNRVSTPPFKNNTPGVLGNVAMTTFNVLPWQTLIFCWHQGVLFLKGVGDTPFNSVIYA